MEANTQKLDKTDLAQLRKDLEFLLQQKSHYTQHLQIIDNSIARVRECIGLIILNEEDAI